MAAADSAAVTLVTISMRERSRLSGIRGLLTRDSTKMNEASSGITPPSVANDRREKQPTSPPLMMP